MSLSFALVHALRESRSSWKRLGLYMSSITLGVAALVAINSFRSNALDSVKRESRALLGADLRLTSNRAFPEPVAALLDTAASAHDVARVTSLVSMGVAAQSGDTRLLQIRAIEVGYPYYGEIITQPAGAWRDLGQGGRAILDRGAASQLGLTAGDTLLLGDQAFVVAATIEKSPVDFGFRNIIAPRVYIAAQDLEATGLLQFGSLAQYQAYLRIPDESALTTFVEAREERFKKNLIDFDTAEEQEGQLTNALDALSRFLGLVGLAALLLGGIGVATAVHVFVKDKRGVIAVLRCLGARKRTVFTAYLLQAAALSLLGALAGVLAGIGVQTVLPRVMGAVVPFDVPFAIDWLSVAAGMAIGLLVAVLFALVPLLGIRHSSPLQALRIDYEPTRRRLDPARLGALGLLAVAITGLSIWQAAHVRAGLAFAGALGGTLLILWLIAWLLTRLTRRALPRRARFGLRQGIANLHRPHNQTVVVTLSLGFGVFVIATMIAVQSNLLGWLEIEAGTDAPNLVAFDIQVDQIDTVQAIFARHDARATSLTPIVPARIAALNNVPVDSVAASTRMGEIEPWALRREYRNTYRDTLVETETIIAGRWFAEEPREEGVAPISMESDVARDLGLELGDLVTWDVQGQNVVTRITSLRRVEWARFNTNFFVVFPSGVLERAPQTFVALGRVPTAAARGAVQRELVAASSNVSVIDLATVREALDEAIGRVTLAVRFMALFSIIAGVIVLMGAIATSRFQRLRESALLKTIGASRRQISEVLVTEYAALGALAGVTGVALGGVASWLLIRFFFKLEYAVPAVALAVLWLGVAALAVGIGLANSRDVFRRAPLVVLREISE